MSIHAHPPRAGRELDAILARAGVNLCGTGNRAAAVDYGSAAGELAACVSRVGLADRSELSKLVLSGPPATVRRVVDDLTGVTLAVGGAARTGGTWWCASGPRQVVAVSEPAAGDRLYARIHPMVARNPDLAITDLSDAWSAIQVVGRQAGEVLRTLGVYGPDGDPRSVAPVTVRRIAGAGGVRVTWLLQSDHRALATMAHGDAPKVWRALQAAGRPLGICAVGREALARYALLARSHPDL